MVSWMSVNTPLMLLTWEATTQIIDISDCHLRVWLEMSVRHARKGIGSEVAGAGRKAGRNRLINHYQDTHKD